jgi:hypothetical protein
MSVDPLLEFAAKLQTVALDVETPGTTGMRKYRSFPNGATNGSNRTPKRHSSMPLEAVIAWRFEPIDHALICAAYSR